MRQRAYFTLEQRDQLLAEFQASGLTATEFARRHEGLSRNLISMWLRRYVREPLKAASPDQFVEAVPLRELNLSQVLGQPAWAAELVLPGGITVRLQADGLAQLLPELRKGLRP